MERRFPNWECLFVHREKGLFLSVYVDEFKLVGKKQNIDPMWKVLNKEVDLGETTSFLDHVYLGCTRRQCEISKDIVDNYRTSSFSQTPHCLRVVSFLCNYSDSQSLFCVPVSRAMVRKGWSTLEVPDGWLKIVRGVRPPSEKWPRAGPQQQRHQSARPAPVKKPQAVSPQSITRASVPPEQLRAAAEARVLRIQASIAALQPEDTEEMEALQRALTKAQRQMVVPQIDQQIVATEEYVTRVQKRLQKHDVTIVEARKALEESAQKKPMSEASRTQKICCRG